MESIQIVNFIKFVMEFFKSYSLIIFINRNKLMVFPISIDGYNQKYYLFPVHHAFSLIFI